MEIAVNSSYHSKTLKVPHMCILSEYKLDVKAVFFNVWFCNIFIPLVEDYFCTKGFSEDNKAIPLPDIYRAQPEEQ